MYGARKKYSKTKRTYRKKTTYRKKKRGGITKKTVARMLTRRIETKSAQFYDYDVDLISPGSATEFVDNVFPMGVDSLLSFSVQQGVGAGSRIGNRITTKYLRFRGTLTPLPYNATTNGTPKPTQIKFWFFYDKTAPTELPNPMAAGDFFQLGGATKSFQGDLTDLFSPINTDRYRILTTRTFKLGYSEYAGTSTGASIRTDNQAWANNDFKLNHNFSINLTKHYPKSVRFNDNNQQPMTRGVYLLVKVYGADGEVLPTDRYLANMQYILDYKYQDA